MRLILGPTAKLKYRATPALIYLLATSNASDGRYEDPTLIRGKYQYIRVPLALTERGFSIGDLIMHTKTLYTFPRIMRTRSSCVSTRLSRLYSR